MVTRTTFWSLGILGCVLSAHPSEAAPKRNIVKKTVVQAGVQGRWQADQNGCKVWNPAPEPGETVTWTGDCVKGFASGYGTERWYKNGVVGNIIEGTIVNNRFFGQVKLIYPNGITYEGRLDVVGAGGPDGEGLMTFPSGRVFRVSYINGKQVSIFPDNPHPDEVTCSTYGLKIVQPEFGQCLMQLEQMTRLAQMQQDQYQLQLQQYQQQMAAYQAQQEEIKREKSRRQGEFLMRLSQGLLGGQSFGDASMAASGFTPMQQPVPPSMPWQDFTLRTADGGKASCTYDKIFNEVKCR